MDGFRDTGFRHSRRFALKPSVNSAWGYIKEFGNQAVRGFANTGVLSRAFDAIITFYEEILEKLGEII